MKENARATWIAAAAFAAVAALRLVLFFQVAAGDPLLRAPVVDAALHNERALAIASGDIAGPGPFRRPPLYPYYLGALYFLAGPSPRAAAFVQVLIGLAGLWLLYRLARLYFGRGAAAAAVVLAGLYGPLALFEVRLLPASLAVFLVLLFLNLLVPFFRDRAPWRPLAAGFAGGLLALDRPNMVFLPLLVAAWLFFRGGRVESAQGPAGTRPGAAPRAAAGPAAGPAWRGRRLFRPFFTASRAAGFLLVLGLAAGLFPAFLHNLAAGDGSVLLCGGGGFNFYLGNRRGAEVSFTGGGSIPGAPGEFADPKSMPAAADAVFAREKGGPPENQAERERFWIAKGAGEIAADPLGWLGLEARKAAALLSNFEYGVNCSFEAEKRLAPCFAFLCLPFWLLLALAAAGVVVAAAKKKTCGRAGGGAGEETGAAGRSGPLGGTGLFGRDGSFAFPRAPLYCVLVSVLLSTLLFFTYSRFRLPAAPVLALFAGFALCRLAQWMGRAWEALFRAGTARRARGAFVFGAWRPASAALLAGALSLAPPGETARIQRSAGEALVGAALFRIGEMDEACAAYRRALAEDPASTKALATLAGILSSTGRGDEARRLFEKALAASPGDARLRVAAALFLAGAPPPAGSLDEARRLAEEAEELDPGLVPASLCRALILSLEGEREEAAAAVRRAVEKSGGDAAPLEAFFSWMRSRGLAEEAGELEKAAFPRHSPGAPAY